MPSIRIKSAGLDRLLRALLLLAFTGMGLPLAQAQADSPPSLSQSQAALDSLASMHGFEADPALHEILSQFYQLPPAEQLSISQKKQLFDEQRIAQWTGSFAEFTSLIAILYSDLPAQEKARLDTTYKAAILTLESLQTAINKYVHTIHPGYALVKAEQLRSFSSGKGIRIAVFDVFDADLLTAQRKSYPRAKIQEVLNFGRPVGLSHGNSVIDIILRLAPDAEILPVSSDSKAYTSAFVALSQRQDIDIVNMSRAFAEAADHSGMDPAFKAALQTLVQKTILVKSLGNTGTDLDGQLTPARETLGLGPIGQLFAYDLKLIRDYAATAEPTDMLLFALNLSLFADASALSATIPGKYAAIQKATLGIPAEGIWSPSTSTFESGSSFAAPQLTAIAALLLETQRQKPSSALAQKQAVYQSLLQAGDRLGHADSEWGLGLLSGDKAWETLRTIP